MSKQRLNELRSKHGALTREYNSLIDAGNDTGTYTPEQRARIDALKVEIPNVERAVSDEEFRVERQRSEPANENADERRAVAGYNVATAMLAQSQRMRGEKVTVDDGREREVQQELRNQLGVVDPAFASGVLTPMSAFRREQRALSYGAGSGSGKGVQAEQYDGSRVTTELQAVALAGRLGVTFRGDIVGAPYSEPKITSGLTLQFVAEGSALTPADPTTDKVTLTPRIAGAVTSISPILLQQPNAQSIVSDHLLRVAAAGLDRVIFVGGGANEPSGLWDTLTPTALGEPTWADILGLTEEIELDNVSASLGWALNPSAKRKLRSTPKIVYEGSPNPDNPFPDFIMPNANTLADYPAVSSTTIPDATGVAGLIHGDFSEVVAGVWESASILLNPYSEADFLRGQIGVRVLMLCDVAIKREEAFRAATIAI